MLLEGRLSTGLVDGVRVVQLDYNTCLDCDHSDMAMFVFVPDDGVSLGEAEEVVMKSKVKESFYVRFNFIQIPLEGKVQICLFLGFKRGRREPGERAGEVAAPQV